MGTEGTTVLGYPMFQKKSLIEQLRQDFWQFCNQTSLHGWQHLINHENMILKLFWLVSILVTISLSIICILTNTNEYLNAKTVPITVSTTKSLEDVTFPSVTICNLNQVEASFLKRMDLDNNEENLKIIDLEFMTGRHDPLTPDQNSQLAIIKDKMTKVYNWSNNTPFLDIAAQDCDSMLLMVQYRKEKAKLMYKSYISRNDMGACCAVYPYLDFESGLKHQNYSGNDFLQIPNGKAKNTVRNGLWLWLDVEKYEYIDHRYGTTGFLAVVVNNHDKPLVTQDGILLTPGGLK